jgi:hypothetical protein
LTKLLVEAGGTPEKSSPGVLPLPCPQYFKGEETASDRVLPGKAD